MGCILRNSRDDFLSCFASKRYGVLSVKEAEAYGLREAMRWVLRMSLNHVMFELDAKAIVDEFYSLKSHDSEFGVVIHSGLSISEPTSVSTLFLLCQKTS